MDDFNSLNMGAKSNNLKVLRDKLDAGIKVPESATLPFRMQEYSIDLEPSVKSRIEQITNQISKVKSVRKMNQMLHQCKELVMGLKFHESDKHHSYMKEQLLRFGIPSAQFQQAWATIKKVWASKYNERAFLATKKLGVSLNQIYMAVLCQRVIPSEYAYVIHTTNPTNGNDGEVYVEACIGMGEALVSDMPG